MTCPDREQLLTHLRGECDAELTAHVEACPSCQAELDRLAPLDAAEQQKWRQAAELPAIPGPDVERALAPLDDPSTQALRRLGGFELLRRLGGGGMGEVWLARHVRLNRLCAVKMLRPDRTGRDALARFRREMQEHAQLDHPNVVDVTHAEEVDGQPLLVMKYVDGHSLHELLQRHGPLPVADACELVRQAALGLQHAYEHGVVHRDLKPSNLMLDQTLTVKVLDFGLARGGTGSGEPLTVDGDVLGTPEYMAPEQAASAAGVDVRADLYALGCTLFFLLTGQPPYPRKGNALTDLLAVLNEHRTAPVPAVRNRRPDVPVRLAGLIEARLLAKAAADRLATPAELAAALKPLAFGCRLEQLMGRPAPAGVPGAPAGGRVPAPERGELQPVLDAELDVLFWDAAHRNKLSLEEPGVLPVKEGDEFEVEVRLNRPAHVYLVWIDSTGQVVPVYPWPTASDWGAGSAQGSLTRLLLPGASAEGYESWPINGPAGVETLVLMAREEPLAEEELADLPGWLPRRFPRLAALPDPTRPRWLTCRADECLAGEGGLRGFGRSRTPADPLFQIDSLLRDRLGTRFQIVRAVSFTNAGPQGDTA